MTLVWSGGHDQVVRDRLENILGGRVPRLDQPGSESHRGKCCLPGQSSKVPYCAVRCCCCEQLFILLCHQGCNAKAMRRRRPWVFACIHKTRPFRGLLWSTDKVRSVKSLDRFLEHFFPQGAPSSGKTPPRTEVARGLFGNFLLRHGLSTWCWSFDFILSLDRIPATWRGWRRSISSCGGLTASSCYWWRRTAIQVKFFRWSWTS